MAMKDMLVAAQAGYSKKKKSSAQAKRKMSAASAHKGKSGNKAC